VTESARGKGNRLADPFPEGALSQRPHGTGLRGHGRLGVVTERGVADLRNLEEASKIIGISQSHTKTSG
jgi:hypothetical protein